MGSANITAFTIPAVENRWDLQEKAGACRHAGFAYLLIGCVLVWRGFYGPDVSKAVRVAKYDTFSSESEKASLLKPTVDGAAKRHAVPAGDYGTAVELSSQPRHE